MRTLFISLFITLFTFTSQAQTNSDSTKSNEPIYMWAGTMPEFPGGEQEYQKFIASNLKYPTDARKQGIEGIVYVQYIVNVDGTLSDIKIVPGKGLIPSCDQAVIDVLKKSPNWSPGLNSDGKPIAIKKIQKVKFINPRAIK